MENRQVECLLSLIVIVYAMQLAIWYTEAVIRYLLVASYLFVWLNLTQVMANCLLIVFFPRIVQWIGYFTTAGKPRSKRRWRSWEILAIPLVLYAFVGFFMVFLHIVDLFSVMLMALFVRDIGFLSLLYEYRVDWFFILLFYFGFAVVVLFNARRIAGWLLRISAVSPGVAKKEIIK